MDYILNVYKDEKFLYAIGGKNMNYDNVIWWQLSKMISVINKNAEADPNTLLKLIREECEYLQIVLDKPYLNKPSLDLTNKTIEINHMNLYDFEDVALNFDKELVKIGELYKIKFKGEKEQFDIKYIEYDLKLLEKTKLTFEELLTVSDFIHKLIDTNEVDYIINTQKALILTEI